MRIALGERSLGCACASAVTPLSFKLACSIAPHRTAMIVSFRHKGLQALFATGSRAGIQPRHAEKLLRQLSRLDEACGPEDMNIGTWKLHRLTGNLAAHYAISVSGNWRLVFSFQGSDVVNVDYVDYH